MKKEFEIRINYNGILLNAADLAALSDYYEAACTANLIFDQFAICPDRALQLGYEARSIMDEGVDEWKAIDEIVKKHGLVRSEIVGNDLVDDFDCDSDLSPYVDSMLFDSGTTIATLQVSDENYEITIDLMVRGDVRVEYLGNVYTAPSEFPDELKERIRKHPGTWGMEAPDGDDPLEENRSIYVADSNWFEYIVDIHVLSTGEHWTDGIMFDGDLSEYTPTTLCEEMANDILPKILENLG